jgi:hypothetical protein
MESGWVLYTSPEGHQYYYNHTSGESKWVADFENSIQTDKNVDIESSESSSDDNDSDSSSGGSFEEFLVSDAGWEEFEKEQLAISRTLNVDTSIGMYNMLSYFRSKIFRTRNESDIDALNSYESEGSEDNTDISSDDEDVLELVTPLAPPWLVFVGSIVSQSWLPVRRLVVDGILLYGASSIFYFLQNYIFASVAYSIRYILSRISKKLFADDKNDENRL